MKAGVFKTFLKSGFEELTPVGLEIYQILLRPMSKMHVEVKIFDLNDKLHILRNIIQAKPLLLKLLISGQK